VGRLSGEGHGAVVPLTHHGGNALAEGEPQC
jgi:hypothetical protein